MEKRLLNVMDKNLQQERLSATDIITKLSQYTKTKYTARIENPADSTDFIDIPFKLLLLTDIREFERRMHEINPHFYTLKDEDITPEMNEKSEDLMLEFIERSTGLSVEQLKNSVSPKYHRSIFFKIMECSRITEKEAAQLKSFRGNT